MKKGNNFWVVPFYDTKNFPLSIIVGLQERDRSGAFLGLGELKAARVHKK